MSGPITRGQAAKDPGLQNEVEAFDPFRPSRSLPRDEDFPDLPAETGSFASSASSQSDLSDADKTIKSLLTEEVKDIREEKKATAIMAIANSQVVSLKDALKVVPEFDGSNIPLSQFLEGCSEAREMIEPAAEGNLVKLIRSKLSGEARGVIVGQAFNTIDALKDHLKYIYAPAKTEYQLLGELGKEFQRDEESVIAFANRTREIGRKILEARKLNHSAIDAGFRAATEANVMECFKRGLRPEIEQRLDDSIDMANIVKNAIQIERRLEAQNDLRRTITRNTGRRNMFACRICDKEGHEASDCFKRKTCDYCKRIGHTSSQCFQKMKTATPMTCHICGKSNHTASQCRTRERCQLCNEFGHSARSCRRNAGVTCQLCNNQGHTANMCVLNNLKTRQQIENSTRPSCQLCEKMGHTAATCRSRQEQLKHPSKLPTCNYCKNQGHTIADCRKRQYNNGKAGNEQSLQRTSAPKETPTAQPRSLNALEIEEALCELIPLD